MKFFVDTADLDEIKDLAATGLLDGVTTNPSLIAKSGRDFKEVIKDICAVVDGPVSAEVASTEYDAMLAEANEIRSWGDNIAVKVPLTEAGLKVCKQLSDEGTMVNVTLCFSAPQALLAAKAGATYISPFIGRLDDIGHDGMELISEIRQVYDNYGILTEILAASIRHPQHVVQALMIGADCGTLPSKVLYQLLKHPLTDKGLEAFLADWNTKVGKEL